MLFSVIFACGEFYCAAVIMSEANNKVLPAGQVLIFACGEFYCAAVIMSEANNKVLPAGQVLIFGLRRVILRCAQFDGEYNITLRHSRKR